MGKLLKVLFVVFVVTRAVTCPPVEAAHLLYDGAFLSTLWSLWTTGYRA